jgi:hypothetical protein
VAVEENTRANGQIASLAHGFEGDPPVSLFGTAEINGELLRRRPYQSKAHQ